MREEGREGGTDRGRKEGGMEGKGERKIKDGRKVVGLREGGRSRE